MVSERDAHRRQAVANIGRESAAVDSFPANSRGSRAIASWKPVIGMWAMPWAWQCPISRLLANTKSTCPAAQKSDAPSPISRVLWPLPRVESTQAHLQVPLLQLAACDGRQLAQTIGRHRQAVEPMLAKDGVDRVIEPVTDNAHRRTETTRRGDEGRECRVDRHGIEEPVKLGLVKVEQGDLPGHAFPRTDASGAPVVLKLRPARPAIVLEQRIDDVDRGDRAIEVAIDIPRIQCRILRSQFAAVSGRILSFRFPGLPVFE